MSSALLECSICREPLPTGEPVAFLDKQQIIHVRCYRPVPRAQIAGQWRSSSMRRRSAEIVRG